MRRSTVARNWRAAEAKVTVEEEPPEMVVSRWMRPAEVCTDKTLNLSD
jgi:hypothetical protein